MFKQAPYRPLPVPEQIASLIAVTRGVFDSLELEDLPDAEAGVQPAVRSEHPELCKKILRGESLQGDEIDTLAETAREAVKNLVSANGAEIPRPATGGPD